MATLRDIRQRIAAVQNTSKITQTMKMVSVAKLKKAQNAIQDARAYFVKMNEVIENLTSSLGDSYSHPLLNQSDEVKNIVLVVVASDKGLCGSFNNNIFKFTNNFVKQELKTQYPDANIQIIPVGRKACAYFQRSQFEVISEFPMVFQHLEFQTVKDIVELFEEKFANGSVNKVIVINNEFKSMMQQVPVSNNLLPIQNNKKEDTAEANADYIFEPSQKQILDELLPINLKLQLWRALLESNAADHAARMMAMDTATNNAFDLINHLELIYNKARQSSITNEMLEIVSGAEALKTN